MIKFTRLNPRQVALIVLMILFSLSIVTIDSYILPAYEEMDSARTSMHSLAAQYLRLTSNLAMSENIATEFQGLEKGVKQVDNDQITLSNFLRDLETQARLPHITIVNIKPLPIENKPTHKVYRVKISLAGRLQDMLQFMSNVSNGQKIIGFDSFSLRGVQGGLGRVECTLLIRKINVMYKKQTKELSMTSTTSKTPRATDDK